MLMFIILLILGNVEKECWKVFRPTFLGEQCHLESQTRLLKQLLAQNTRKMQNTYKLEKMPAFFMHLGTDQAWETDEQVWNLYFALIMNLQSTVTPLSLIDHSSKSNLNEMLKNKGIIYVSWIHFYTAVQVVGGSDGCVFGVCCLDGAKYLCWQLKPFKDGLQKGTRKNKQTNNKPRLLLCKICFNSVNLLGGKIMILKILLTFISVWLFVFKKKLTVAWKQRCFLCNCAGEKKPKNKGRILTLIFE